MSPSFPAGWTPVGRAEVRSTDNSIIIQDGFLMTKERWGDCTFSFRARAPQDAGPVQIWAAVRVRDRESRYVVGYRGGREPELSLARYAPEGQSKFLGWTPLNPVPQPGNWVDVRVVAVGKRFQIYLNKEELPRINIEDTDALWTTGGVALGGGWLPAEFAQSRVEVLSGVQTEELSRVGSQVWAPPAVDKGAARIRQRAAYRPLTIAQLPAIRGDISLDGDWLFMPEQEIGRSETSARIASPDADDQAWHVLPVPSFWTPTLGWLYGEDKLPGLKGVAASRGPSDALIASEFDRVNDLTFDWNKTKAGWYRRDVDLPPDLKGRNFELVFDAIAKVSEIWVDGQRVISSTGMFRQVRCDVTPYLKPGRNVIAVHDVGVPENGIADAEKVAGTAVTVEVTDEMLNSLPHGMTNYNCSGIWQPVHLLVTGPVRIRDVFVEPSLEGARIEMEIVNGEGRPDSVGLSYTIVDHQDGSLLYESPNVQNVVLPITGNTKVVVNTPKVRPKLWSPSTPHLYDLKITLHGSTGILDREETRFGFRTFTVKGDKLVLNGKPYWLRGADPYPVILRPNDAELARQFIGLAKEGNVAVTRSHGIPFTEPWLDAADELGLGVSYEGTWPWLMLKGPVPDSNLIKVWREEFSSLIQRYRNHPSILFWTVNNEMKFPILETMGPKVLEQKWSVLDGMIHTMRQLDPTRPIVADSSYTRHEADPLSKEIREKSHFDDGDIDDAHRYYGWYNESPFHLFDGKFGESLHTPGRPLISQEMSTGYPRNDDWPSRSYEFQRYVPQALVGDYAFEENDPSIFLTRQAFMTKEVTEAIRRTNRDDANGILLFSYLTWFTNVWKIDSIRPKLTYEALKKALQPVLVSAELYGRHFYAGESFCRRVCIANDAVDFDDLPVGALTWKISAGDQVLAQGSQPAPALPYYRNEWLNVTMAVPAVLPAPRVDAKLSFALEADGKTISENDYDVVLATAEWAAGRKQSKAGAQLYDPKGLARATTEGMGLQSVTSPGEFDRTKPLVIGDLASLLDMPQGAEKIREYVGEGGHVLLLQPRKDLIRLFPGQIRGYRRTEGEIVTMMTPESPVFDGIEPLDTAWFERGDRQLPYACIGTYEVDATQAGVTALALECELHSEIKKEDFFKVAGFPLIEIRLGKGVVLASEILLSAKDSDPVARRLLSNMLSYLK